ncbi:hypothetical protein [Fibrobacter succinogenes]|uniref:hypothetical protein n=1 Tax=Fibrobacter succinogenes TaxID=833 RepID=UPI0013D2E895|nr:hypothetical protein [Fibrobacter succinogenes]
MKKLLLLPFALLLASCAPSRVEPTVTTKGFSAFNGLYTKVSSRTLSTPVPKPITVSFDGDWDIQTSYFSLEKNLAFFMCTKEPEHIQFRGMRIEDLYRDATFTVNKNAPEEKFIKFYLQWDHNFWATRQEKMKNGKVSGPAFNSEKKYGTIRTVNGEYQRCVLAAIVEDALFMMTGEAVGSDKDICQTEAEIWESHESF